ncbi:hypothetical protein BV22DRAFT_1133559 [Leucogyrophana mollusca]|uniref:Uncharacterized protein n=1 Tax=Leucogyrophana mollusca TaxID=85980 RepID=A0ACB8B3T1_9AGAM|nr:hypothetical protein BV22DRAFT_1133559 [Leucogyrophana mollusca]
MLAPASFSSPHNQPAFPALYLYPLNDTFIPKHVTLIDGQRVKIGRQTNTKTVPAERNGYFDSKVLSRQHAEIWEEGGRIFMKDVKSSNGTFINGERLSPKGVESYPFELKNDDIVEFGIDIIGEDNKTIIHHKVTARVMCVFTEEDMQIVARVEQMQGGDISDVPNQQATTSANPSFSFAQNQNGPAAQQRRPTLQSQDLTSPPTASNQNPLVRGRARSATPSILDLPAVPEPVVPHRDDGSPSGSDSSRGSSFDSILDLPAVLEPGKRRPKKKRPPRRTARAVNDSPLTKQPIAATVPQAELVAGNVDLPLASKATTDEINAGPSAQNANADLNTSRSRQGAFARFTARFSVPFRRQTLRSPETRETHPTTSNCPPAPEAPDMQPISRPLQRTPTVQTVDVSAAPATPVSSPSLELPNNQRARRERDSDARENAQASHSQTRSSRNQNEANVAFGQADLRLYIAPPRGRDGRRFRARARRGGVQANSHSNTESDDSDVGSEYDDTGCLDAFCFLECSKWWRHRRSQ